MSEMGEEAFLRAALSPDLGPGTPSWLNFPDVERAEWLNALSAALWPHAGRMADAALRRDVEPMAREVLEGYKVYGFKFEQVGEETCASIHHMTWLFSACLNGVLSFAPINDFVYVLRLIDNIRKMSQRCFGMQIRFLFRFLAHFLDKCIADAIRSGRIAQERSVIVIVFVTCAVRSSSGSVEEELEHLLSRR